MKWPSLFPVVLRATSTPHNSFSPSHCSAARRVSPSSLWTMPRLKSAPKNRGFCCLETGPFSVRARSQVGPSVDCWAMVCRWVMFREIPKGVRPFLGPISECNAPEIGSWQKGVQKETTVGLRVGGARSSPPRRPCLPRIRRQAKVIQSKARFSIYRLYT